jgi:PAS domain S-box-containing protein
MSSETSNDFEVPSGNPPSSIQQPTRPQNPSTTPHVMPSTPGTVAEPTEVNRNLSAEPLAQAILDQIGEAVVICDLAGMIIRANAATHRYYPYDCLHRPFDEIFRLSRVNGRKNSSAKPSFNRNMLSRILGGEPFNSEVVFLEQQDGMVAEVVCSARPLRGEDQKIMGGIITFLDSGLLKRDDHILKRHNEVLEHIINDKPLHIILEKLCLEIEQHFLTGVRASVLLLDEEGRHLRHVAAPSLPDSYTRIVNDVEIGPEVGSCGASAYLREPVYVANISEHPNWAKFKDLAESHEIRACWSTPILGSDGHALGTFALYSPVPRLPSDEEKEFVEFLTQSASIAIEKGQAKERLFQKRHALEVINQIGHSLTAELNLEKLLQFVTDACCELTGAEFGAFFYNMINEEGETYVLYTISGVPREAFAQFPMPRNTPIFAPTFSGETVVRLADVLTDPRYGQNPPYHGMPQGHLPVRSYLAVPVVSGSEKVLGGLFFGHSKPNVFSQTAEKIVTGIAPQVAIAIANARLYESAQNEIEQRKHISENLQRLGSIVESSQDAIYSINMEGCITSWNQGAERMYGYTSAEMINQSFSYLLPQDIRQDVSSICEHLLSKAGKTIREAFRITKNGSVLSVSLSMSPVIDADGTLIGASLIERDISEQKRIGEALQTSESRLHAILDNSPAVIFVKDVEGRYQLINKQFESIFQISRDAIIGKHDDDFMDAHTAGLLRENDRRVLDSLAPQEFEESVPLSDGHHMYLSIKFPLLDGEGTPFAVGGMATDITARKKSEQALKELNDSLEQRVTERTRDLVKYQENLRAMASELVLTEQRERRRLATELHDYLAQLLVVCRMKLTQATNTAQVPVLKASLEEIDQILSDSLSYTRTLIAELSPTILYELGLIPALVWVGQQMERHGLSVQVQYDDLTIQLPEDHAIFVFQAVRELLFNVIKHAGVAEATVSIRRHTQEELEVLVQDAGNGFQPSRGTSDYTTPGKFGIFSIRERIEALGGQFHVRTAPGKGTQASLIVPLKPITAPVVPKNDLQEIQKSMFGCFDGGSRNPVVRILLVDDHAMIRQGIRTLLENEKDFLVVGEAQNGEEALEISKRVLPEVVVMDVNMPKLNGIEATRILTLAHPLIKVIGLSVHEDANVEQLLLQAGASRYVTKGSVAHHLVEAIRATVNSSC